MPTFAEALGSLDDRHFVGRERELALFREWLALGSARPTILNVIGRGGIGKSTLLRAFARITAEQDRAVVQVDGRNVSGRKESLLQALGGIDTADVATHLNRLRPVVLLDTSEELGEVARYLSDELLPRVESDVKVVISGRYPLGQLWAGDSPWQRLTRPVTLDGFSPDESQEYLNQRGLAEQAVVEEVLELAGGNPLALALAADMALQLGVRHFAAVSERHLLIRTLVEQLLRDVKEPLLRELLEVCAVVRQFDEDLLAAVSDRAETNVAFDQLCHLSVVRPSGNRLRLHDDVRRAMAEDLRWRRPERFAELRRRALAYYRTQSQTGSLAERARLMSERLFFLDDAFVRLFFFNQEEGGRVWLEPGTPDDHPECVRIYPEFLASIPEEYGRVKTDRELEGRHVQALLKLPEARLRVARDPSGQVVGFCLAVPLYLGSIEVLGRHPAWEPLLRTYYAAPENQPVPASASASDTLALVCVGHEPEASLAVRSALFQSLFGTLVDEGVYLLTSPYETGKQLYVALGAERVPEAQNSYGGSENLTDGYVLDLRRIGFEAWIEAVLSGRRPPKMLSTPEMEAEVQAVFANWHDDGRLAASPLTQIPGIAYVEAEGERPEVLRAAIRQALERAQASAKPGEELAYRALELAYLQRGLSHDRAADRLAVSRATFYRLLRRGVQGVAAALSAR